MLQSMASQRFRHDLVAEQQQVIGDKYTMRKRPSTSGSFQSSGKITICNL